MTTQPVNQSWTKYLPWLLLAGVLYLNHKPVAPATPVVTPSATVEKDSVKKLRELPITPEVSNKLANLHGALADILSRTQPGEITSGQLKAWMGKADSLYVRGTELQGSVPGFDAARSAVFEDYLGLEDEPLDAPKLQVAVEAAKAVESALRK